MIAQGTRQRGRVLFSHKECVAMPSEHPRKKHPTPFVAPPSRLSLATADGRWASAVGNHSHPAEASHKGAGLS